MAGSSGELKESKKNGFHKLHFGSVQASESSDEAGETDRLNLLEMKSAIFQKILREAEFPLISSESSRMGNDCYHGELIVFWEFGEKEAWAHFTRDSHVGLPDFASFNFAQSSMPFIGGFHLIKKSEAFTSDGIT